jgi:hypothetical protein
MFLIELFKYVGIDLSGTIIGGVVPVAVEGVDLNFMLYYLSAMVFIFSVISLISVLNIILYFLVIMYSDKIKFIQDLSKKSPLFAKILKSYKNTRIFLIVVEIIIFVECTGGMIFISFIILTKTFV